MQSIYFDYSFTDLNTYIDKERSNKMAGASIKRRNTSIAMVVTQNSIRTMKIAKYSTKDKIHMTFIWHRKDKMTDPDNVCFAKKFILDGMQKAGLFKNDEANTIVGFEDKFVYTKSTIGVLVELRVVE